MRHSPICYLLLLLTMTAAGGASCRRLTRSDDSLSPAVFVGPPTLEDVIFAVNTNSARVRQLYSENASVSTQGFHLRADVSLERPRRFRLRAKMFVSQELDLGSNDHLFWVWTKHDPDRATYYAYHDQQVTQGLPVGPDWLIESLGLLQLDPAGTYEGPTVRPDRQVEVRSRFERHGRPYVRILVLDDKRGWIQEQQILDSTGQRLAIARCSDYHFYPEAGVSLPHRVNVELPTAQLSFQVDVGRYLVNQLNGDPAQLFEMPNYEGFRPVNLGATTPGTAPMSPGTAPAVLPGPSPRPVADPRTAYRPQYRGLGRDRE